MFVGFCRHDLDLRRVSRPSPFSQRVLQRGPPQLGAPAAAGTQYAASPAYHCHC